MKISRIIRRMVTGMLCAAMLITALPGAVFAEQLPDAEEVHVLDAEGETDGLDHPALTEDDDEKEPESTGKTGLPDDDLGVEENDEEDPDAESDDELLEADDASDDTDLDPETLILSDLEDAYHELVNGIDDDALSGDVNAAELAENGHYWFASNTNIIIPDGCDVTIRDIVSYSDTAQLTIKSSGSGTGKLTLTERIRGINASKKPVIIEGGHLVCDRITDHTCVEISGGTVDVNYIQAAVEISGGDCNIDEIVSTSASNAGVTITDGSLNVNRIYTTGNFNMQSGRVYAFSDDSIYTLIEANNISISGGILNAISDNQYPALKANTGLTITGGIVRAESVYEAGGYAVSTGDCAINEDAYFMARSNSEAIRCEYPHEINVDGMSMTEISTGNPVQLKADKRTLTNSEDGTVRDVLIENESNTHVVTLDQTTLAFADTEYSSAPPAEQTVTVTNTGTGPVRLTGIISNKDESEYTIGDIEGGVSLAREAGVFLLPSKTATFTVRPNEMLATGEHNETFTVTTGDDEVSASVDATFKVTPTNYKIEATNKDATVDFGTYRRDYLGNYNKAPETKTVTIKNTGQGAVTVLDTLPTDITTVFDIVFPADPADLILGEGESLNLTVTPKTDLAGGDYDTVLYVKSNKGVQAPVNLKFKIKNYDYTIAADKTTLSFGRKNVGYVTAPAALNIKITNKGEKNVTIKDLSVLSEKYDITPSGDQTVAPKKTVTYVLRPKIGLTSGNGNDTISIETVEGSTPVDIALKFDVGQYLSGTVNASDLTDNGLYTVVGDTIINIAAGDNKTIKRIESNDKCYSLTIAGDDAGKLTVTEGIIHNYFTSDGRAAKKLKITGGTVISPKIYEGSDVEITGGMISVGVLSSDGNVTVSGGVVDVKNTTTNVFSLGGQDITVTGGKISAHNDKSGSGILANGKLVITGGYVEAVASNSSPGPDRIDGIGLFGSNEVTIGGDACVIAKGTKEAVVCGNASITADGMKAIDLDSPLYSLATVATDAEHNGHFVVVNDENVIVTAVVKRLQIEKEGLDFINDYTFSVSPSKLDFGTMVKGCMIPDAQTVLITNTGKATLKFGQITCADSMDIVQSPDTVLMPGESTAFTVRPKADLAIGNYANQQITVSALFADSLPVWNKVVTASVEVVNPVYAITATPNTIDFGTFAKGYIAEGVPAQTITLTNTGNVAVEFDLDPTKTFAHDPYTLGELPAYSLIPGESMAVAVTIEDGTVFDGSEQWSAQFTTTAQTGSLEEYVTLKYQTADPGVDGLWIEPIPDQTYNGAAIKPAVNVYYRGMKLTSKDYTVSYKNNTNAYTKTEDDADFKASKAPTATVKGKGNYAGTATAYFVINPLDISQATAPELFYTYNSKKEQFGKAKVTYNLNGKTVTLKENRDFVYEKGAGNYKDPSEYTTTVRGIGNYKETLTYQQTIIDNNHILLSSVSIPKIPDQIYSGKSIKLKVSDEQADPNPEDDWAWAKTKTGTPYKFTLKDPKTKKDLECGIGKDFTLTYPDDYKSTGTVTVTINGQGKYVGSRTVSFKIIGTKLSSLKTEGFEKEIRYNGNPRLQPMRFYYTTGKGKSAVKHYLTEGVDYNVEYINNTEIGTATAIYTGRDPYVGTVKKTYKIKGIEMKNVQIPSFANTTGKFESGIPIKYIDDDEQCYNPKKNTFIYTGLPFEVAGVANAESAADNAGIQLRYYDKKSDMYTNYVNGEDYYVTYAKNVLPGTATVTFTGKGRLSGSVKKTFKIAAYDIKNDPAHRIYVTRQSGEGIDYSPYTYTKGGVKPDPKVRYVFKNIDTTLTSGTDYSCKWTYNDAITTESTKNKPTLTITGKGAFTGSRSENYRITGNLLKSYTNTATVDCTTTDVIYQEKAGICKTTLTLTDKTTHAKLVAGTDYDKNLIYRYELGTDVRTREKVGNKYVISDEFHTTHRNPGDKVDQSTDVIPVGTWITVSVIPLANGKYNTSTDEEKVGRFCFIDKEKDISKMSITIDPYTYNGQPVALTSDHIIFKYGKNVINPAYDPADEENSAYRIEYIGTGYTNKGTYKVKIVGNPEQGYTNSKIVSFTVKARTMDYSITYNTAMDQLAVALAAKYPEHNALWYQSNYRIVGTPTTSVTAKGAALPKFTYTIQKMTGPDQWVKDSAMQSKISFTGWKIDATDTVLNNQGRFYPPLIATFLYGDNHTLYAQWELK